MRPSPSRRAVFAWCLYDFANSPFSTLIVTFIYAPFFIKIIVGDEVRGTGLWSLAVTVTGLVVAVCSPPLGAAADRGGFRKLFLGGFTSLAIVGSALLFLPGRGDAALAFWIFVTANVAFELAMVFYNAFLPDVAPPERIGRISGYGWGLGYLGGLAALVVALLGFVKPETPWFGIPRAGDAHLRATTLLAAGWFLVFALPLFAWVGEDRSTASPRGRVLRDTWRQLIATLREIRRYRQVVRLLVARMFYNDGLVTVFAFGGVYAAGTFGFEIAEILVFGIALNVTAGVGALVMGFLDDRLGGKKTIAVSLVGLLVTSLGAVLAPNRTAFWAAGLLLGIFAGPSQSASRSLMGRFVPPDKENEFFGFFAFSGKATAFLGPFLLGRFTEWSGSQRAGVAVVPLFFLVGLWLLARVDEAEGVGRRREEERLGSG
jgi:UMF1 family MFS transporter